jgi:hypothetical protein
MKIVGSMRSRCTVLTSIPSSVAEYEAFLYGEEGQDVHVDLRHEEVWVCTRENNDFWWLCSCLNIQKEVVHIPDELFIVQVYWWIVEDGPGDRALCSGGHIPKPGGVGSSV